MEQSKNPGASSNAHGAPDDVLADASDITEKTGSEQVLPTASGHLSNVHTSDFATVTNKVFMGAVFHTLPLGAYVYGTAFKQPPDLAPKGVWFGGVITDRSLTKRTNYTRGDCNTFYVVSSFFPDKDGNVYRRKANFAAAHIVTLDDIGSGPSAKIPESKVVLPGSYVIETSPENCQVGYILSSPVTDADLFNRTVDALIHQGLASASDPGMRGVTRYVRMPVGINNKTKYDPPHRHVLKEWHPERQYTLQDIIDAYGLDLAPPTPERSYSSVTIDIDDDPYVKVLSDLGLVLTGDIKDLGDGRQMLDILCPFHHEHSDRAEEGAAYFIGAGFRCFHGHCENRTFKDVKRKLRDDHHIDTAEVSNKLKAAQFAAGRKSSQALLDALMNGRVK